MLEIDRNTCMDRLKYCNLQTSMLSRTFLTFIFTVAKATHLRFSLFWITFHTMLLYLFIYTKLREKEKRRERKPSFLLHRIHTTCNIECTHQNQKKEKENEKTTLTRRMSRSKGKGREEEGGHEGETTRFVPTRLL